MKYHFAILRCPTHKFDAISLDNDRGVGTRITGGKCCGRWNVIKDFPPMNQTDIRGLIDILTEALAQYDEVTP